MSSDRFHGRIAKGVEKMDKFFNKWVFMGLVVLLYGLVVVIALFTHQPSETMTLILNGSAGVGFLLIIIAIFA